MDQDFLFQYLTYVIGLYEELIVGDTFKAKEIYLQSFQQATKRRINN